MAHPPARYDVFICHTRGDVPLARALRVALQAMGRTAFAAEDDVRPGAQWNLAIPDAQDRSKVVAVLISQHWQAGHYNHGELATAIARYREDPARRVVPVLFDAVGREAMPYGLETFAPLIGDRDALGAVARGLLAAVDDAYRVEFAADLSVATTALEDLEAAGADPDRLAEARARVIQLKRALRAGGQLSAGDRLGRRYKLEEAVGDGGFATVWRAWDRVGKRRVAVKVLHPQHARDHSRRQRFVRGAHKMAAFDHPHIVPVLVPEANDDGFHYFVMAWMPGGDLRAAVLDGGLTPAHGRQVLLDAAAGLAAAHAQDLIHRDVKPGNVLIDDGGRARLSDFDLVRAPDTTGGTRTGGLGTTLFAAPEAFTQAKDADARADVYGLGMTAVFILLGRDLPGWVLRKPEKLIEELGCNPALKGVLHRAVEFEADARWPTVGTFVEAVERTWSAGGDPTVAGPTNALPPGRALIEPGVRRPDFVTEPVRATEPDQRLESIDIGPPGSSRRLGFILLFLLAFGFISGGVGWVLAGRDDPPTVDAGPAPSAVDARAPAVDARPRDAAPSDARPVDARPVDRGRPGPKAGSLVEPGTVYRPTLVHIPGGSFTRGSPEGAVHREADEVSHGVELRPFVIATTPVTQAHFERVFNRGGGGNRPAAGVTFESAISYCNRLSALEGRAAVYRKTNSRWTRRGGANGYRLPTEAEWEYACRAGDPPADAPDVGAFAWYVGNSQGQPQPVRSKAPNRWGLYDMLGNVWEWTADRYGPYSTTAAIDPRGPDKGALQVIRGSSYRDPARSLRCPDRYAHPPDDGQPWIGFRVVRAVDVGP